MSAFSFRRPPADLAVIEGDHVSFKGALSHSGRDGMQVPPPTGFNADTMTVVVGKGDSGFVAAREALQDWVMFSMPWITLVPKKPPMQLGAVVVVAVRVLGAINVVNASRITMLVDEQTEASHHFGFVYATLHNHAEKGEEIFLVTHHLDDDRVEYSLAAHSRPAHWLSWLGYPVTRWYQRRFRSESAEAMRRAVAGGM